MFFWFFCSTSLVRPKKQKKALLFLYFVTKNKKSNCFSVFWSASWVRPKKQRNSYGFLFFLISQPSSHIHQRSTVTPAGSSKKNINTVAFLVFKITCEVFCCFFSLTRLAHQKNNFVLLWISENYRGSDTVLLIVLRNTTKNISLRVLTFLLRQAGPTKKTKKLYSVLLSNKIKSSLIVEDSCPICIGTYGFCVFCSARPDRPNKLENI